MSVNGSWGDPPLKNIWALEPGRVFLNHGSYGACPKAVIEEQNELRWRLEHSPSNFMNRLYPSLLKAVREKLCNFLNCHPLDLALLTNATSGINAVLRSLEWQPGDEILLTDHGYNACRNVVSYLEQTRGVKTVQTPLPFPALNESDIVERLLADVSPRTRLALLDHVSSPTGLIFPIERLARELSARGILVAVDGAHAPGMLDLNFCSLAECGVNYYAGNFHKWCCAPRGSAFLWVAREYQTGLHPGAISHGFSGPVTDSRYLQEFDWCGTFDPTAWLVIPSSLNLLSQLLPGGWQQLRSECQALLLQGREIVAQSLPKQPLVAEHLLGQLATLELPSGTDPLSLHLELYDDHGIDSWTTEWNGRSFLRLSAAPYNLLEDYEKLAKALGEVL